MSNINSIRRQAANKDRIHITSLPKDGRKPGKGRQRRRHVKAK